jgi:hypothetical protein
MATLRLEGRILQWRGPVAQRYMFVDVAVTRRLPLDLSTRETDQPDLGAERLRLVMFRLP